MRKRNELKLKETYRRGMARLEASPSFREQVLNELAGKAARRRKWKVSRLAPICCAGACALCLLILSFSLLPFLRQNLVAENPGKADSEASEDSGIGSASAGRRFLLIRLEEQEGTLMGTLASEGESDLLSPDTLRDVLLESGFSGILLAVSEEGLSAEGKLEASRFLSGLESSGHFTVLSPAKALQPNGKYRRRAWAQVALTPLLKGEERLLLSEEPCVSLASPLFEGLYPLSGGFGLPERDGSFHTGAAYRTEEGETLLSPADGTVVYREPGAAVLFAGKSYIAVSGMADVFYEEGDAVSAGEPLGKTAEGEVYLSILSGGFFVDPTSCLLEAAAEKTGSQPLS